MVAWIFQRNRMESEPGINQPAKNAESVPPLATFREQAVCAPENPAPLSLAATRQTLHELRICQIELELQNEELRCTQAERDTSQMRYSDCYDLAPVGYFTITEPGLILEGNITTTAWLGVDRDALVQQPLSRFIFKEDQCRSFHRRRHV